MKRLESNFQNMVLSLTFVSLVAAAALGGIYVVTKEPIDKAKAEKQQAAISAVLPADQEFTLADPVKVPVQDNKGKTDTITLYSAYNSNNELIGTAVETSEIGFGGKFKIMVGFDGEGKVVNYQILEHQETPGLGSHMTHWFKNADKSTQNIIGRQGTGSFGVSKDGGDVDAITAATISSRAFLSAINKAYNAFTNNDTQAISGATIVADSNEPTADEALEAEEQTQDNSNNENDSTL